MLDDNVEQAAKPESGFRTGTVKTENSTGDDPKPETEQPKPEIEKPKPDIVQPKPETEKSNPKGISSADPMREGHGSDYPTNVAPIPSDTSSSSESNPPKSDDNPDTDPINPESDQK